MKRFLAVVMCLQVSAATKPPLTWLILAASLSSPTASAMRTT